MEVVSTLLTQRCVATKIIFLLMRHSTAFSTAPILGHFDYDREIVVETDASDYILAGILSQYDNEGTLHPATFYSKKHSLPNATTKSVTKNCWQ